MNNENTKCSVKDRQLSPCWALDKALEIMPRKGAAWVELVNLETHTTSRSFALLKSGEYSKKGIVMNFCPFCGADIASHMQESKSAR